MNMLAIASGLLIAVTGAIHSLLGEKRMIRPLLVSAAFAASPRTGRAIRFTWHMATLLMLLTALTLAWPGTPAPLVGLIGAAYLLLGLLALAVSRGRHVSGPLFTAAGLLAVIASAQ